MGNDTSFFESLGYTKEESEKLEQFCLDMGIDPHNTMKMSELNKSNIIKAGNYDELPIHLQQEINRLKDKVNQPIIHKVFGIGDSLEQKIKDILLS